MWTLSSIHQPAIQRTLVAIAAWSFAGAVGATPYEAPTDHLASEFIPSSSLQGGLYTVDDKVAIVGGMPRFTIRSKYGVWEASGREMLDIRVSELPALEQLDKISKTDEFGKALKNAVAKPVGLVGDLVVQPGETVGNIGSGIGTIFGRVGRLATTAADSVSDTVNSDKKVAQKPILKPVNEALGTAKPRTFLSDPLGYNSARRDWSQRLKIDPYTSNATLSEKLDEFARVTFAGTFPVNVTVGVVAAPITYAAEFREAARLEAYQRPPGDIEKLNEGRLKEMGIEGITVRNLFRNSYYTPTLQTSLVLALKSLGKVAGGRDVIAFATRAASESEARYVINSLALLSKHSQSAEPIISVRSADNVLTAKTRSGNLIVAVPLEYIPWVKPVEEFAKRKDLAGNEKWLLVAGKMTEPAKQEVAKYDWKVTDSLATANR
jgi:hypothetical protein